MVMCRAACKLTGDCAHHTQRCRRAAAHMSGVTNGAGANQANGTSTNGNVSSPAFQPPSPSPPIVVAASTGIKWTVGKIFQTIGVFLFAGLAEIGGGWLVWQTVRLKKPWYYFVGGAVALVAYGVIPTLQPEGATFARVYAVYGGVFIVLSYGWGWVVDGDRPDNADFIGAAVALAGVCLAWFWPR